jgi:two-component system LytT family response regulator
MSPPATRLAVVIADDEPPARHGLRAMLAQHADLEVVAEARSGREAVAAIVRWRPAIAVLDVLMPEGSGLDVAREVLAALGPSHAPEVVFATAYDEYALRAFELHAVGYVVKPVEPSRLAAALARARRNLAGARSAQLEAGLLALLARADEQARYLRRLTVRSDGRLRFLDVDAIDVFEAERNYVRVYAGRTEGLARVALAALAARLDPGRFARVHRSRVVNVRRVVEAEPLVAGEYVLVLAGGRRVTTGRSYRAQVQQALGL